MSEQQSSPIEWLYGLEDYFNFSNIIYFGSFFMNKFFLKNVEIL